MKELEQKWELRITDINRLVKDLKARPDVGIIHDNLEKLLLWDEEKEVLLTCLYIKDETLEYLEGKKKGCLEERKVLESRIFQLKKEIESGWEKQEGDDEIEKSMLVECSNKESRLRVINSTYNRILEIIRERDKI